MFNYRLLANNGTVAGVKSMRQITTVLLRCYQRYEYHVADFRLQSNNPIIISSCPTGKKTCVRRTQLWEFLGVRTLIYALRDAGFCIPENPDLSSNICLPNLYNNDAGCSVNCYCLYHHHSWFRWLHISGPSLSYVYTI